MEAPAHGYELLERLRDFDLERDPGNLYRTLRAMEHEKLVASEWEPSFTGPDRRRYALTQTGERWLDAWAEVLADTGKVLERYSDRYRRALVTARV